MKIKLMLKLKKTPADRILAGPEKLFHQAKYSDENTKSRSLQSEARYGFLFSRNNSIGTISATAFLRRVTGQQKDKSISLSKQCAFFG